jgi:hypothetical protein
LNRNLPFFSEYKDYHKFVDENFCSDSSKVYGLSNSNAKLTYLNSLTDNLFPKLLEIQTLKSQTDQKEEEVFFIAISLETNHSTE